MFAAKLGLAQVGYPNIAVYDGEGEYLGRVIGFGGRDSWFKNVQETWGESEKLSTLKAAAEKDPARWCAYATEVGTIAGREKDAMAALDRIPEDRRDADYKAVHASLAASVAWTESEKAVGALTKTVKTQDDFKAAAPKILAIVESWLQEFQGASAKLDPLVLAKKGQCLVILERKPEAIEVAQKILHDWPDSPQAQNILRSLR